MGERITLEAIRDRLLEKAGHAGLTRKPGAAGLDTSYERDLRPDGRKPVKRAGWLRRGEK